MTKVCDGIAEFTAARRISAELYRREEARGERDRERKREREGGKEERTGVRDESSR